MDFILSYGPSLFRRKYICGVYVADSFEEIKHKIANIFLRLDRTYTEGISFFVKGQYTFKLLIKKEILLDCLSKGDEKGSMNYFFSTIRKNYVGILSNGVKGSKKNIVLRFDTEMENRIIAKLYSKKGDANFLDSLNRIYEGEDFEFSITIINPFFRVKSISDFDSGNIFLVDFDDKDLKKILPQIKKLEQTSNKFFGVEQPREFNHWHDSRFVA